jgi:hypothetical protein
MLELQTMLGMGKFVEFFKAGQCFCVET